MHRIIRISLILLFFSTAVFDGMGIVCADNPRETGYSTYEGRISDIDWVASRMTVNGVGSMEFHVPKEARITKLGSIIMFADLNILDDVIVKYYEDPSGKNVVVRITVVIV
jgi:hypothetical protein